MENKKETLHFRIDTPQLLADIVVNALTANSGVLYTPLNIFRNYLGQVTQRAIELNDPKLNILMLEMNLYECEPFDIPKLIEEQKKRITEDK